MRNNLLQKSEAEVLQSCEQNLLEEREGFLDKNCRSVVVRYLLWFVII